MTEIHAGLITVIIVAAGRGERFGGERPKQFTLLGGRPLLMLAVERVRHALPAGTQIVIALHAEYFDYWHELLAQYPDFDASGIRLVTGGATRWHSVKNALGAAGPYTQMVMVHDAARPLVSPAVMQRMIEAIDSGAKGVVPAVDVTDSLRRSIGEGSSEAVDRSEFLAVQTPQAFPCAVINQAYAQEYSPLFTDDASVVEAIYPGSIVVVEGCHDTIKLTRPADLATLEYILDHEC